MREETLKNVEEKNLGKKVAGFAADGATSIKCKETSNGKWTIVASFPEDD